MNCFLDEEIIRNVSKIDRKDKTLAGSFFMRANLFGKDLGGADLTGANLAYAELGEANLAGAEGFGLTSKEENVQLYR